jgi:hypothetical protein
MARKCKKCGREIVKTDNGFWKDRTGFLPFYCLNWELHEPKKKKAICKYCGRDITKKGKNWKDHTKIKRKECFSDFHNLHRKHKPAK